MGGQTENTFQFLKEQIINGTFKPSQKLTEAYLAQICGVSRNTVKKALMMLERENLVEVEPNKGATIKSYTLEEIVNYLEIREALEGLVARRAAKNITVQELEKLQYIFEQMATKLKENRFDEYSMLNREFHDIIYAASKNSQAVQMINTIKTQLNRIHFRTILIPGRSEASYQEHKEILEAIKDRDEEEIERAIRNHVANVRLAIVDNYHILV
jgi:DNA-binding GntR family transcriptional regulator